MLEPLLSAGKLQFLHMEEISPWLNRIEQVEQELKVSYVRNDMLALAAMMPVIKRGNEKLIFSDVSIQKVRTSREYGLVQKYFAGLTDMENTYVFVCW